MPLCVLFHLRVQQNVSQNPAGLAGGPRAVLLPSRDPAGRAEVAAGAEGWAVLKTRVRLVPRAFTSIWLSEAACGSGNQGNALMGMLLSAGRCNRNMK